MTTIKFRTGSTVALDAHMASDMAVIRAARVSTQGEEAHLMDGSEVDPERFIRFLMRDRHGSPFEHTAFRFFVETPMFVAREWFWHRIGSFNEESARYRVLKPHFYVPPRSRPLRQLGKPGAYRFEWGTDDQYTVMRREIEMNSKMAYGRYQTMLGAGIAREVARDVLPTNVMTSFYWTVNARALLNFISLRSTASPSTVPTFPLWEIDEAAQQVEREFGQLMPITHQAFKSAGRVAP
ncbi:FAD-dependent thymidylate synthase [Catenuloplanes sp. NPDC051500]|uniref:FAD-dependent thymidylate synthase n=1 Tax=Catenuloplanes sp. NPDC051500 TaxID=3363959 RepID=UPI0037919E14